MVNQDDHDAGGSTSLLDEIYAEIEEKSNLKNKQTLASNSCCTSSYSSSNSSSNSCTCSREEAAAAAAPALPTVPPPPLSNTSLTFEEEIEQEIRTKLCDTHFHLTTKEPLLVFDDSALQDDDATAAAAAAHSSDSEQTEYLEPKMCIVVRPEPAKKSATNEKNLKNLLINFQSSTPKTNSNNCSFSRLSPSKLKSYLLLKAAVSPNNTPQQSSSKVKDKHFTGGSSTVSSRSSSQSHSHARQSLNYLVTASSRFTSTTLKLIRTKSSTNNTFNNNNTNNSSNEQSISKISAPTLISQTFDLSKQNLIQLHNNIKTISSMCSSLSSDSSLRRLSRSDCQARAQCHQADYDSDDSFNESNSSYMYNSILPAAASMTINSNVIITNVYEEDGMID
jgi:hypothetical protein